MLYRFISSYLRKYGHKRKIILLALQYCQKIPIYLVFLYRYSLHTQKKLYLSNNVILSNSAHIKKNDILWGVSYIYQCWFVLLGITVKPEFSSFFCDRFYSYIMKTNDTAWHKVKSSSVERGHNHLTQRAITLLIFRFMSPNFLWWRIYIVDLLKTINFFRIPKKMFIIHAEKAIFVQNYVISSNSAHIPELTFFGPYRIFISADWHFLALL